MVRQQLVLSLFPGIGILDTAFEAKGFCIVRGPDLLWGGDVKRFHPPSGAFSGVIGGPPCQAHSRLVHIVRHRYGEASVAEDLIPEFIRVVDEARPTWWVMENVESAPIPDLDGYKIHASILNNRWLGGEQSRKHRFSFGTSDGRPLHFSEGLTAIDNPAWAPRVLASGAIHYTDGPTNQHGKGNRRLHTLGHATWANLSRALELQGLPPDHLKHCPFTAKAAHKVIGNAVAYPIALCLAAAVLDALQRNPALIAT